MFSVFWYLVSTQCFGVSKDTHTYSACTVHVHVHRQVPQRGLLVKQYIHIDVHGWFLMIIYWLHNENVLLRSWGWGLACLSDQFSVRFTDYLYNIMSWGRVGHISLEVVIYSLFVCEKIAKSHVLVFHVTECQTATTLKPSAYNSVCPPLLLNQLWPVKAWTPQAAYPVSLP